MNALSIGYRLIDTAQSYFNEEQTGNAIARSGVAGEDIFLTTKVWIEHYGAYRALEDLYDEGKLRAIGVSNFYPDRLVDIASFSRIKPMVNQVETHPFNQQSEAKKWMNRYSGKFPGF